MIFSRVSKLSWRLLGIEFLCLASKSLNTREKCIRTDLDVWQRFTRLTLWLKVNEETHLGEGKLLFAITVACSLSQHLLSLELSLVQLFVFTVICFLKMTGYYFIPKS